MHSPASFTPRRASLGCGPLALPNLGALGNGASSPMGGGLLSPSFLPTSPSPFSKYYDEHMAASPAPRIHRPASTSNDVRQRTAETRRASAVGAGTQLFSPPGLSSSGHSMRTTTTGSSHFNANSSPRASPQGSLSSVSSSPSPASPSECTMEYLADLVREKKQLEMFLPQSFTHVERLVEEEINRVRVALFQCDFTTDDLHLPEPEGEVVCITEKLYVPRKEHPEYNFVGRILGPRGMTAKQLEQETGCKIMVRGKGSMRDKRKEEANRGKPNWEHLEDELHVLIQCEDTANRASVKMRSAVEHVKRLLIPAPEGTDELKRKQLMELAIINGTYRPFHGKTDHSRLLAPLASPAAVRPSLYSLSPTSSPTAVNSSVLHPSYLVAAAAAASPSASSHNPFDYSMLNQSLLESFLSSYQLAAAASSAAAVSALGQSLGGQGEGATPAQQHYHNSLLQALPANFFDSASPSSNHLL